MGAERMNKLNCLRYVLRATTACALGFVCSGILDSHADYTRVNVVNSLRLPDVSINCDFRLRFLAGSTSNNSYKITYVSQNVSQGYIMEAPLTSSQVQEFVKAPGFISSRTPVVLGTPVPGSTHALRVLVPLNSGSPTVTLLSGGQTFPVNPIVLDLEKQCATTTAVSTQAGGSDGCAMLAFKQSDGSCRCAVDPLANSGAFSLNPCASLVGNPNKTCVKGGWDPVTGQSQTKCIGPVDQWAVAGGSYFFNSRTCACELCDSTIATRSPDASSCTCKFSNLAEVMAIQSPPRPPGSTGTALDALKDKCMSLYNNGPGGMPLSSKVFFDKSACSCSVCPQGFVANADQSGCVKM